MPRLTINNTLADSIYGSNDSAYFDVDGAARDTNDIQIEGFVNEQVAITDELTSDINLSTVGPLQSLRLLGGWNDDAEVTLGDDQALWLESLSNDGSTLDVSLADGSESGAARVVANGSYLAGELQTTAEDGTVTTLDPLTEGEDGELDTSAIETGSVTSASLNSVINVGTGIETLEIESQSNTQNSEVFSDDVELNTELDVQGGDSLETLNITGVRNFTLNAGSNLTSLTAINASALTAAATIDTTALTGDGVEITGSDNADTFTVRGGDSVNAGAGNDRVDVAYSGLTDLGAIDGGEGSNQLRVSLGETDTGELDLANLNEVTSFERVTLYSEDNDVTVDAADLADLNALRFADADPDADTQVTDTDDNVIGNGNNLDVTVTNATADQRIDAIDGGDLDVTAAAGVESLSIRANFLNDGSEEGEAVTLTVGNATDSDSLSTLDLGGDGRIAYDAGDDAEITTINAGTLTGGLTLTGGDDDLAETITLAQWQESYNGTGRDDISVDSAIGLQGDLIDTIENFDVARDTVSDGDTAIVGGTDGNVVESADVSGASSLLGAFQAASETEGLGEGQYAAFSFDGDTYLYGNTNTGDDVTDGADSADFALRFDGDIDFSALADNSGDIVDIDSAETPDETDGPIADFIFSNDTLTGTALSFDDFDADANDGSFDLSGVTNAADEALTFADLGTIENDSDGNAQFTIADGDGTSTGITLVGVDASALAENDFTFA